MTSWKLTTSGLFNECAVYTCSGRTVRDQQPDFPKDNATGALLPPSVALASLFVRLYVLCHGGYKGGAELLIPCFFLATGKHSYEIKHQLGCFTTILVSRQLEEQGGRKYLVCVMRSREKKWSGCNMLGMTTKPATWMDRNLAGKMNGSWEIAHKLERTKWMFWRIGTGLEACSQEPKDTIKIACAIQKRI